jgi:hypothetical protein
MAFMSEGVPTGFMGGLNAGEIDVGFGSEEDTFDWHFCCSARETKNLRSLNIHIGLSHGLKCRQLKRTKNVQ